VRATICTSYTVALVTMFGMHAISVRGCKALFIKLRPVNVLRKANGSNTSVLMQCHRIKSLYLAKKMKIVTVLITLFFSPAPPPLLPPATKHFLQHSDLRPHRSFRSSYDASHLATKYSAFHENGIDHVTLMKWESLHVT